MVDDEEYMVEILRGLLESLGYDVASTTSSLKALELFKSNPDRFDLVITDMAMPRMDGKDLSKKFIEIRQSILIILCTGFSETMDERKARDMGIKEFVMKPIVKAELAKVVRRVLDN